MKVIDTICAGILLLASTLASTVTAQQIPGEAATVRTIDVGTARPVLLATQILAERYHIPITYEEPRYINAQDLQDISYVHKGPVPRGVKLVAPRAGTIHFQYAEVNGKPQEDITSLIRRLLTEYAAQGGPVFDVRERTTPNGPEWNVVAVKARGSSGGFVDQPDILGALIFIPKARRSEREFLVEMLQQLRTETGYRVMLGTVETRIDLGTAELGADNVPARDVLVSLFGRSMVWGLNYDPEGDDYVLNLVWTPRPRQPLNAFTLPSTPRPQPTGPTHIPMGAVMHMARMRGGIMHIQSVLAQAGYYNGEPTGQWDEKTINGLKQFQAANNLRVTGRLDPETIRKLGLDVVTPH